MKTVNPALIKSLRKDAGLTQKEAADMVRVSARAWQLWESGSRRMPYGLLELFVIKTRIPGIILKKWLITN